jgi:hypothetical protein
VTILPISTMLCFCRSLRTTDSRRSPEVSKVRRLRTFSATALPAPAQMRD